MKEFQKYEISIFIGEEKRSIVIEKPSFIIGRSLSSDIPIQHDLISREHLKVMLEGEDIFIEDLGSTNGSWYNGNRINPKKLYPCLNETQVVLGNISGPFIVVSCIFKSEVMQEVEAEIVTENEEEDFEEITLIRKNLLIETSNLENNIVNLRSEALSNQIIHETVLPKVANGYHESVVVNTSGPHLLEKTQNIKIQTDLPANSLVEPDLLLQMKNLLDFEAQKAELESKKEAEEIKNAARKKAEEIIAQAIEEASEIRLNIVNEASEIHSKALAEIERLKLANIKEMDLLSAEAHKKSVELVQIASRDDQDIRLNAKNFSEEIISKAREKSEKLLKETEYIAQLKIEECKKIEEENEKNIQRLSEVYQDLKGKIENLKELEKVSQENYEHLSKSIEKEEERISIERLSLDNIRSELAIAKKEHEQQQADFKYEERSVKAQLETEMLEQKLQVARILAEAQQAQILKDTLAPEILSLKNEKDRVERLLKAVVWDHEEKTQRIEQLGKEEEIALSELNNTKELQKEILKEVEKQKDNIKLAQEKIAFEEREVAEKIKKAQSFSLETEERIKQELLIFTNQKLEMEVELQKEKKKQLKTIEEETQEFRNHHIEEMAQLKKQKSEMEAELLSEKKKQLKLIEEETQELRNIQIKEITQLKNQKAKIELEAEKSEIESISALDKTIKKYQADALVVQKVIAEETQKLKAEAHNQAIQVKGKFDNLTLQLKRDYLDAKKSLTHEIAKIEASKKNVEHELRALEIKRNDKIKDLDLEIKELIEESRKKSAVILGKSEIEFNEQKASLALYKETEMASIKELKEKALKEIHGKKSERAKAAAINIDAFILTEFQKFRNKKMNDQFIDSCSKEINTIVYDTLMDRIGSDRNKLDIALKAGAKFKKEDKIFRERIYWLSFIFITILALVILPKLLSVPEISKAKTSIEKNISTWY